MKLQKFKGREIFRETYEKKDKQYSKDEKLN